MTNLRGRLDKLENRFGLDESPILFPLKPRDWERIRLNRNIPVIYFYPDKDEHDRTERLAEIDKLKESVAHLTIFFQSDGCAVWEDGKCIKDGGLGHE